MRKVRFKNGFTLVELLVALIVTSIITAAVATLAFALSSASEATGDLSQKQAQVRFATLKINDLIRHSRLVCFLGVDDIALWSADKNNDNQINVGELVYIEKGPESNHLWIYEFPVDDPDPGVSLSEIGSFSSGWWSSYVSDANEPIKLIPECDNVQFRVEGDSGPVTKRRFVSISFDVTENDVVRHYEISNVLRSWAGNLLNDEGNGLVVDDD